jgi:hypothetical protein
MPKEIIESMKRDGVRNPYALLNAAGWKEGDSSAETKRKLSKYQKRRKRKSQTMSAHEQAEALGG